MSEGEKGKGGKGKGGKGRREGPCRCERRRERSLAQYLASCKLKREVGWGMRRGWDGMGWDGIG